MTREETILREAMKRYPDSIERNFGTGDYEWPEDHSDEREAFIEGAEWADKTMIDKAVEWLENNWREYVYQDGDGIVHFGHWESDLRKAMEE